MKQFDLKIYARTTLVFVSLMLLSCKQVRELPIEEDPTDPAPSSAAVSGDIIVSNGGSRSVLLLNEDGEFKKNLFTAGVSETIWGIAWIAETSEVAVAIDGVDRIIAISTVDGSKRDLFINLNFTGNLREMTQLASGDFVVIETSSVERFTAAGDRVATGGWPKSPQVLPQAIGALAAGGFVMCSMTTDVVRTYTDDGTQVASAASGIATALDGVGCVEMDNGNIAVAWSGTNDTIQILNPSLGSVLASYSNISVLGAPGGMAQAANGNLLVVDQIFHYLVEISPSGTYVRTLGGGLLNAPRAVLVVP